MNAEPVPRLEAVLFDLDGTLADTLPDLVGALDSVARDAGAGPVDAARLRPLVSRGGRAMIESVLAPESDSALLDLARRRFLDRYRERIAVRTGSSPGWTGFWRRWTDSVHGGASSPTSTHG